MNIPSIPRLTSVEWLILQTLVVCGEIRGSDIVKESDGVLSRSGIYMILSRMIDKGYVKATKLGSRKVFRVTDYGARLLEVMKVAQKSLMSTAFESESSSHSNEAGCGLPRNLPWSAS